MNINENVNLVNFLNELLKDSSLSDIGPLIIKFFIITRNYGLIDYQDNIEKLRNTDFKSLCLETIEKGFKKDNIIYNNDNLVKLLVTNYHDNGFYFHSFPGIYKESIINNGLLANNRNKDDEAYFNIANKYHFGDYFVEKNNIICVTEMLGKSFTNEYALLTPEWLDMFLKQGTRNSQEAFMRGDVLEMQKIADTAIEVFNFGMQRNPNYDEKDYLILKSYIKTVVERRFSNGNKDIGIALIPKKKSDKYFKNHIKEEDIPDIIKYINTRNNDPYDFLIDTLPNAQKYTEEDIPNDLIYIISYQTKEKELDNDKTMK